VDAARMVAHAEAVEEVAAAVSKDEKQSRFRAFVSAAVRRDATAHALALRGAASDDELLQRHVDVEIV
jgi:hypothetical protein